MDQESIMSIQPGQLLNSTYKILEDIHKSDDTRIFKILKKKDYDDDEPMALKVIKNQKFKKRGTLQMMKKSFLLMAKWDSPYLMKCFNCYDGQTQTKLQIQYLNESNLHDYLLNFIRKNKTAVNPLDAVAIAKQAVLCVKALYLVKERPHGYLKLTDFVYHSGVLKLINSGDNFMGDQIVKNHENSLFSPEVLKDEIPTTKSDVWSIGAILLIALLWKVTNQEFSFNIILEKFKENEFSANKNIQKILKKCLIQEPKQRMTIQEVQAELDKILESDLPHNLLIFGLDGAESESERDSTYSYQSPLSQEIEYLGHSQLEQSIFQFQEKTQEWLEEAKVCYHEFVKSQYIWRNIINDIRDCQWSKKNNKTQLYEQIMYLFISRLYLNVTQTWAETKKIVDTNISSSLRVQIKGFYQKVKEEFEKISSKLQERQKGWIPFLTYPITKMRTKFKFMSGMEGRNLDFSKEEQIEFTMKFMEKNFIDKLQNSSLKEMKLIQKLKKYKEIVFIMYKKQIDFQTQVNSLLEL